MSDVRLKIGWQGSIGGRTPRASYDLELLTRDGKRTTLGKHVRDKREAEWLVRRIRDRLRLVRA